MTLRAFTSALLFTRWVALAACMTCAAAYADPPARGGLWRVLPVGGGGWLTGIDLSPDGSVKLVRADTYGAYRWSEPRGLWTQLVTRQSMSAADVSVDSGAGVYEIRVAPSLPTRIYMAYAGRVYRSDDSGGHWSRTAFEKTAMDANDAFRTFGAKMAVDPVNADIVYVGTPRAGLRTSVDGGRTWSTARDVPASLETGEGGYPGIAGLAFDKSSGAIAGQTRIIYAASFGHGVYRSTNGGVRWEALDGGPLSVSHGKIAADGVYYAVGDEGASLWRFDQTGWSKITPGGAVSGKGAWATVVTDPFDAARIVAVREGGSLTVSVDRGATWQDAPTGAQRVATDVPWLGWTQESYMSVGELALDPAKRGTLWFAEGIGVWRANVPSAGSDFGPVTFVSQTAGIEQLVANQIIVPPGGSPLLASWDRPIFRIDDVAHYPTTHGPDNERAIVMGWALDYAAHEPTYVAGLFNWWGVEKSGYSNDGGRTWSRFASDPPATKDGKIGGSLAVSTPSNIVWAPSNNSDPYFTRDGGATWAPIGLPQGNTDHQHGWSNAYYLNRHIAAADRVLPGRFYLYNTRDGLYRSDDGGATFALAHAGEIAPYSGFNASLRAVPGHAGHLFFTSGPQGGPGDPHPAPNAFMRSRDGGATWSAVDGVLEVHAFGFGRGHGDYPAIYVAGWVHGDYGIWLSQDDAASWVKLGDYPLGILDRVTAVEGDSNVAERVYVGFGGAGYAYGVERR
jgi:hypothetical protein